MFYQVGGFVTGVAISSVFVINMNDIIYTQLRRNVIAPFKKVLDRREKN